MRPAFLFAALLSGKLAKHERYLTLAVSPSYIQIDLSRGQSPTNFTPRKPAQLINSFASPVLYVPKGTSQYVRKN